MNSDDYVVGAHGSTPESLAVDYGNYQTRVYERLLAQHFEVIFWDLALKLRQLDFEIVSHGPRDYQVSQPALFSRRGKLSFNLWPKVDSYKWASEAWPLSECIKSASFQFTNLLYAPEEGQVEFKSVGNIEGYADLTVCWGISLGEISRFDAVALQEGVNLIDTNGEESWFRGIEPSIQTNDVYSSFTIRQKIQLIKNLLSLNYSDDFDIRDKSWLLLDFIYHLELVNESTDNRELITLILDNHIVGDIFDPDLPPGL